MCWTTSFFIATNRSAISGAMNPSSSAAFPWPVAQHASLLGVIFSAAFLDPGKTFPGTAWNPWVYLREVVQLGLVVVSLWSGQAVRRENNFNYGAILEVAVLFLGIFICMQVPLQIIDVKGPSLGLTTPAHFFWASGSLSAVLDNAPTYAVFFETARSLGGQPAVAGVQRAIDRDQPWLGIHGGDDLHRQRPELHGQSDRREVGRGDAQFLRVYRLHCPILLPLFVLVTCVCLR